MRISAAPEGGLRVSVWRRSDLAPHLVDRPASWHPPKAAAASSPNAKERIGYLQVEIGDPGLGTTYDLMVACRNADPAASGGFAWGAVPEGAARESVRMFPQDFVEDLRAQDAWMQPLSTWRPADPDS